MKKYIFFLVSLITPTISWAQVTVGVRFNNPLLYVSSISNLRDREGEELGSNTHLFGLHSGIFARIPLKEKHWALHTELLYKTEGTSAIYDEDWDTRKHFYFQYIDAPILLHWEGKRMFRGYLQAGISPKFLTSATYIKGRFDYNEENVIPHFHKFVLTGQVGGGVLWDIKRVVITTDVRMSWNLTPITGHRVRGVDFSDSTGFSLALVSVGVGYKLGYRKEEKKEEQ